MGEYQNYVLHRNEPDGYRAEKEGTIPISYALKSPINIFEHPGNKSSDSYRYEYFHPRSCRHTSIYQEVPLRYQGKLVGEASLVLGKLSLIKLTNLGTHIGIIILQLRLLVLIFKEPDPLIELFHNKVSRLWLTFCVLALYAVQTKHVHEEVRRVVP